MPKKDDDSYIISETGNWNVADGFSKSKIMEVLVKADLFQEKATFGFSYFLEDKSQIHPDNINDLRIEGMIHLLDELTNLIYNTRFAVKKEREVLEKLLKELKAAKKIIPQIYKTVNNEVQNTSKTIIDEKNYQKILDRVIEIKSEINEPLNKNHLIFTDKEEFDPQAYKQGIKDRMINHG